MNRRGLFWVSLCVGWTVAGTAGCLRKTAPADAATAQVVTVSLPIVREVRDYVDFTGRTEAVESVDVRARVTGYLEKVSFKEGAEVKKGDKLFLVDPRPFKAQYDEAKAQTRLRQANLTDRQAELERNRRLLPQGAITQAEFDKIVASHGEAVASLAAAEASAEVARLNLEFTDVLSPIQGRISRANITVGNLVKADDTLLTTVVSQDPMYVYFDVDERTMLRVTRMLLAAKENVMESKKIPVLMGLADEEGFPHTGFVNFADNVVDPSTGTVTARGVFDNPPAASSARLLRPGMFVRVRVPLGEPRRSVLVAERALGTDQGKKYLLVVDEQSAVQYRPVEVGALQDDGLRVIAAGLAAEERVIVNGLQLVRPKMQVKAEEAAMATSPISGSPPPAELAPKAALPKDPAPKAVPAAPRSSSL